MMWQSSLPRVCTIATWPLLCTDRKWCFWRAARIASTAILTLPSVPFLKPTGADRPDASSRCTWLSVVRAPQELELVAVTPSFLLQFSCIFQRRERIVDRARPHHYQQPVAAAVQDLAHAAARLADQALDRRALDRKEADQVLRRRQRDDVLDALVVGERGLVRRNAGEIAVWWRGHLFPFPKTQTARPFGWRFSQDPGG